MIYLCVIISAELKLSLQLKDERSAACRALYRERQAILIDTNILYIIHIYCVRGFIPLCIFVTLSFVALSCRTHRTSFIPSEGCKDHITGQEVI